MKLIQGITDAPNQTFVLQLADGSQATLALEYRSQQLAWFYSLTYGTKVINGRRLVTSPNVLRQFRNLLPFGLGVLMPNAVEPENQNVFLTGVGAIVLLSAEEVAQTEATYFGGL